MEALTSHCSPGFLAKNHRRTSSSSPMTTMVKLLPVTDSSIRFLRTSKSIGVGLGFGNLVRAPLVRSVPPLSSSLPEVVDGDDVSKIEIGSQSETVHVKFVLQKSCLFGEQFLLTGDDPIFGLWDPENAIPLDWSEGHFWTAEMDLPIGKSVHFKFIHQAFSGALYWQPDPDRVLETWETANTIVVTEDWYDAEEQKITEEQLTDLVDKVIVSEDNVEDGDSSDQSIEEVIPMVADESSENIEEVILMVAGEKSSENIEEMISPESKAAINQNAESIAALLNLGMSMDDNDLASNEDDVVLVPHGPTPVPVSWSHEAASGKQLVDVLLSSDRAEECNSLQLSEEQGEPEISNENLLAEETDALSSKSIDGSEETVMTGVLSVNDMLQWGREALRQLLSNLGFGRESNT